MKGNDLLRGSILFLSFFGLLLATSLFYKTYLKKPTTTKEIYGHYVKLDPSRVNLIKIVKPLRAQTQDVRKTTYRGRRVSSTYKTSYLNDLFGPFGPLKGLSARERFNFKKQVVAYVDTKIRRGIIDPKNRFRYIEMKVLDKSLEMLEASATN